MMVTMRIINDDAIAVMDDAHDDDAGDDQLYHQL